MAWQNLPSTSTPLNDTNLNSLDNSIIEGTWTPTISALSETAPTVTYTTQVGKYKKIGKLVYVSFYIRVKITALNGTNNYAIITGLPYTVGAITLGGQTCNIGVLYGAVADDANCVFAFSGNIIRIQKSYGAVTTKWKVTSGSYCEIGGSGWYYVD